MRIQDDTTGRNARRSRIYSGRLRRTIFGAGLRHPTIFLHLPKCGGTSLSEALYATVPMQKRVGVIDAVSTRRAAAILTFGQDDAWLCHDDLEHGAATFALREAILASHCCWNTQLVHGHVLLTEGIRRHFLPRYKLVTIMRDPVARAISNYRMAVAAGIADADPEAWLDGPLGRAHATTYLRYLSGQHHVPPEAEATSLATALAAVDLFTLIGFLDDIAGFGRRFETDFGASLSLQRHNQARGEAARLSAGQMDRLRAMCAADQAIHDHARARFAARTPAQEQLDVPA